MKYYCGIDNGVSGAIAILDEDGKCLTYRPTPVFKSLNYTKVVGHSTRVDGEELRVLLIGYEDMTVLLERPMINPMRWKASVSAVRCDEATRIILEGLNIKFIYCDSKEWQKEMLPKRTQVKNAPKDATKAEKAAVTAAKARYKVDTKSLSLSVGQQLFPQATMNSKSKDHDALLIAEWARREKL
jgi:hypothetical protein